MKIGEIYKCNKPACANICFVILKNKLLDNSTIWEVYIIKQIFKNKIVIPDNVWCISHYECLYFLTIEELLEI